MKLTTYIKKKFTNFMYDHYNFKNVTRFIFYALVASFAGMFFAFGFTSFITDQADGSTTFITGGISGISQNIIIILKLCGVTNLNAANMQSILYFAFNIPILIFAYFKVGKMFTLLTLINVGLSSVFITVFNNTGFSKAIYDTQFISGSPLTRVFFAGVCSGASSALTLLVNASCGGLDVITYYLSLKRRKSVGTYGIIINFIILSLYFLLMLCSNQHSWNDSLVLTLYSIVYLVVVGLTVDLVNISSHRVKLTITTDLDYLADTLISIFPHSATVYRASGAYSGHDHIVIDMIVSSREVNRVINVTQKIDEKAFIYVTNVSKVIGNFFKRPIE